MLVDLHIHSRYSDSTRSLEEIVQRAKSAGIGLIALCDHNMTDGYETMLPLCKDVGISLILGTEINSLFEGTEFHVLAYGFDIENIEMCNLMKYNRDVMKAMGNKLISILVQDYEKICMDEFTIYERNEVNGGWESMDYLKSKGIVDDFGEYIKLCGKYNFSRKDKFKSIAEITNIIHNAGGKAVLAHAGDMVDNEPTKFKEVLPKLVTQGVDGFECYYTSHTAEVTDMLIEFCKADDLLITAGSDDHGGFNNIIDGKEYYIGGVLVEEKDLNLEGIEIY